MWVSPHKCGNVVPHKCGAHINVGKMWDVVWCGVFENSHLYSGAGMLTERAASSPPIKDFVPDSLIPVCFTSALQS